MDHNFDQTAYSDQRDQQDRDVSTDEKVTVQEYIMDNDSIGIFESNESRTKRRCLNLSDAKESHL